MREEGFNPGLPLTDIQRIRVISYIKQIFHTRLACTSPIVKQQLADFRKSVTKINVRAKLNTFLFTTVSTFGLLIIQSGVLRLQRYFQSSIYIYSRINILVLH